MNKKMVAKQGLGSLLDMVRGTAAKHLKRNHHNWIKKKIVSNQALRDTLNPETLEKRFAFDVEAFAADGLDQATIVVSNGDDLHLRQVYTDKTTLMYGVAGGYDSIPDPVLSGRIPNFQDYDKLLIAEGVTIEQSIIETDGSPAWGADGNSRQTFFLPQNVPHFSDTYADYRRPIGNYQSNGRDLVEEETRGTIEVYQPDGTLSTWGFTNWNQNAGLAERFDNQDIKIVEGPNYGGINEYYGVGIKPDRQTISPGKYYPVRIFVVEDSLTAYGPKGFMIEWNQAIAPSTKPVLRLETYQTEAETTAPPDTVLAGSFVKPFDPPPTSALTTSYYELKYTLDQAKGFGLVPGAFFGKLAILPYGSLGEVEFAGTDTKTSTAFSDRPKTFDLQFKQTDGTFSNDFTFDRNFVGQQSALVAANTPGPARALTVRGFYDAETALVTILVNSSTNQLYKPGRVQMQDVRYAVYDAATDVETKTKVYFNGGENYNAAVTVDLLTPGTAIYVNSPINAQWRPDNTLPVNLGGFDQRNPSSDPRYLLAPVEDGGIALRASEIYLNADVKAQGRIDIGATTLRAQATGSSNQVPPGVSLADFRDPTAITNVFGNTLVQMEPVLGHEGSGYSPDFRPKVTVARSQAQRAEVSFGNILGGVAGTEVTKAGLGYSQYANGQVVNLTVSGPASAGWDEDNDGVIDYPATPAAITATFDGGQIVAVNVVDRGFGYRTPPTITIPSPAAPATKTFTPQQAVITTQFGGVVDSLSIDIAGYNYREQEGGLYDPGADPNDENSAYTTEYPTKSKILLEARNSPTGPVTSEFIVYPTVGPDKFVAQAEVPKGQTPDEPNGYYGLVGTVELEGIDLSGNGIADITEVTGNYSWRAAVNAAGVIEPYYTLVVDAPPVVNPALENRPIVEAVAGDNGRIDRYEIVEGGTGYGVKPTFFVDGPQAPREPGTVTGQLVDGTLKAVPKDPDLVFDIAKNIESFKSFDGDRLQGGLGDRQEIANIEILFKNEVVTVAEAELSRILNDEQNTENPWSEVPRTSFPEGFYDGITSNTQIQSGSQYETRITRVLEVQENMLDGNWETKVYIDPQDVFDEASYFEGELVSITDIPLNSLLPKMPANVRKIVDNELVFISKSNWQEEFEALKTDFGDKTYRLSIKTFSELTWIQPNGLRKPVVENFDEWKAVTDEQVIGRSYLSTGYGYQLEPGVIVERESAEDPEVKFQTVLDEAGRIRQFNRTNSDATDNDNFREGREYSVAVSALRNPGATEYVEFNSTIESHHFDVRVADDIRDDTRRKGELYVAPLTTIQNVDVIETRLPNGDVQTDEVQDNVRTRVYIEADTTDVIVSGRVVATEQSYVFQSPIYRQLDGPFTLTTRNRDTGAVSGQLAGETLTIGFGAETDEFDRLSSIITHVVDVDTNLAINGNGADNSGSIRVTAGENRRSVFPVDITVRDASALSIDSNINSSGVVAISSAGSLEVNAAIETTGDLILAGGLAEGRISLSGPLTSTRGSISITGDTVDLRADLEAEGKGDSGNILLNATGGDVRLAGTVRAASDGTISIQQTNPTSIAGEFFAKTASKTDGTGGTDNTGGNAEEEPGGGDGGNANGGSKNLSLLLPDRETTTQTLTVNSQPPEYEKITVSLDIEHDYVSDLSAVLVSPGGTERYTLFNRNGGSSDDFREVTFDSFASRPIASSQGPFSGAYRPIESLRPPLVSVGEWQLEITDHQSGFQGTLNSFSISFVTGNNSGQDLQGDVSGVGLLQSGQLFINAEGDVGQSSSGRVGLLSAMANEIEIISSNGSVGVQSKVAADVRIDSPANVAISALGFDAVDERGKVTPTLNADIRNAQSIALESPYGSLKADVYVPSLVEITGFGDDVAPTAAGSVEIAVFGADAVIQDAPVGGTGVVDVERVVEYADLPLNKIEGDVEGYVAGRISGEGFLPPGYDVGDKILIVGEEEDPTRRQVSLVIDQLGFENSSVPDAAIIKTGSGYDPDSNIPVTFNPPGQRNHVVTINNGGSGYEPDGTVEVAFGVSPTGDTTEGYATTNVQGQIEKIEITKLGSGYESVPVVTIELPPAKAEADSVLGNGIVSGVSNIDPGSGYTPGATNIPVAFSSSPTGDTATGLATADAEGRILSIEITNEGSGYLDPPSVFITLPQQAIAEVKRTKLTMEASQGTLPDFNTPDPNLNEITGVKKSEFPLLELGMDVSGSGVPVGTTLIGLSGPDENQTVTLSTSLEPGAVFPFNFRIVESVEVLNTGYSYTEESSNIGVVFSTSPTGDTARGKAVSDANGKITEVEVTYPGSGYGTKNPTITILAPAVTRAEAVVQDNVAMGFARANNNGEIESITITSPGSDYRLVPIVGSSISNGTVDDVDIRDPGSGYTPGATNIPVAFSSSPTGDTATGQATADTFGRIASIQITHGGSGYVVPPDVEIAPSTATVPVAIEAPKNRAVSVLGNGIVNGSEVQGVVTEVELTERTSGYTSDQTNIQVTFSPAPLGGITATGYATADAEGRILSIEITNGGFGYVVPPVVEIASSPNPGVQAEAISGSFVTVAGDRVTRQDADGNTVDVTTTEFYPWVPVRAGEFGNKRELVWLNENNGEPVISVWALDLDSNWNRQEAVHRESDPFFKTAEHRYNYDFDGDGSIGFDLVENKGFVRLERDTQNPQGVTPIVNGVRLTSSSGQDVIEQAGWAAKAADILDDQNIIAWQKDGQAGQFLLWVCNDSWERVSGLVIPAADTARHAELELALDLDLNADGFVGQLSQENIRGDVATVDSNGAIFVNGSSLQKESVPIKVNSYPGWRVLGAVAADSSSPASVLWGHSSGRVAVWELDANSEYVADGVVPDVDTVAFESFKDKYKVELGNAGFWSLMPTQTLGLPSLQGEKSYSAEKYTGVYEVVSTGGVGTGWLLVRASEHNTGVEFADRLFVSSGDDNPGTSDKLFWQLERLIGTVGNNDDGGVTRVYEVEEPDTKISTSSGNMTYVVSQSGGGNESTGSLGRAITLIESNEVTDQGFTLGFSDSIGKISPVQELPVITRPIVINGNQRWFDSESRLEEIAPGNANAVQQIGISGSKITLDREGSTVSVFTETPIDGIVLKEVAGDQGRGQNQNQIATLKNIEIGGFEDGAALLIENSNSVFLDSLVIGSGGLANLSGNSIGIQISGSRDVTIDKASVASNQIGLLVEDGDVEEIFTQPRYISDSNRVISSQFINNNVGARLGGSGRVSFGISPVFIQPAVTFTLGDTKITIPDSGPGEINEQLWTQLHLGMAVSGNNIPTETRIVGIDVGQSEIVLSAPVLATVLEPEKLTFGEPWSVSDSSVIKINTNLKEGLNRIDANATLLQSLGVNYGTPVIGEGIYPGTFVLGIDLASNQMILSRQVQGTAFFDDVTEVGFVVANDGRNEVLGSNVGIELSSGEHTLVRNKVHRNDIGVLVSGSANDGEGHQVGRDNSRAAGFANIIESNIQFGVLVSEGIEDGFISGGTAIEENVFQSLGALVNSRANIGIRRFQQGLIRDEAFLGLNSEYVPDVAEGVDPSSNLHRANFPGPGQNNLAPPIITSHTNGSTITTLTPTVSGTGIAGHTIKVYANGQEYGSSVVDENEDWSVTNNSMTAGLVNGEEYEFTAVAITPGLDASAPSAGVRVSVDTSTATPVPGDLVITTSILMGAFPTISGTGPLDTNFVLTLNGAMYEVFVESDGTWEVITLTQSPIVPTNLNPFIDGNSYSVTAQFGETVVNKSLISSNPDDDDDGDNGDDGNDDDDGWDDYTNS